jgi:hypothetical protein
LIFTSNQISHFLKHPVDIVSFLFSSLFMMYFEIVLICILMIISNHWRLMHIFLWLFKSTLLFCFYRFNLAMMNRFNVWTLALLDYLSTNNKIICSFLLLRTSLSLLGRFLFFHMALVNFNLLLFQLRRRILVPILSCLSYMGFGLRDFDLIPSLWWCFIRSRIDLPFILACSKDLNESIFLLVLRGPLFFPLLKSILPHLFFLL